MNFRGENIVIYFLGRRIKVCCIIYLQSLMFGNMLER
jgi:hypothetical protein